MSAPAQDRTATLEALRSAFIELMGAERRLRGRSAHKAGDFSAMEIRALFQLANPIEKLQVADGVFDQMPVDEVAPLLMLPIGLALRTAA